MEEFKLEQNFQKEIGFGQQFGFFQDIINTVLGQQVVKLILWKVEEMLDIQNLLEEDLNHLVRLCIGVQIGLPTNGAKLTPKNQLMDLL
jgi:hypothetical protein